MNGRKTLRGTATLIMFTYCALEAKAAPVVSEIEVMRYLSQFGYLPPVNPGSEGIISEEMISTAISKFQSFMGTNITGNLDLETARLMVLPRCGVKDEVGPRMVNRIRRYALDGDTWLRKSLTYKIGKYSRKLNRTDVNEAIAKAFSVWTKHTDLSFSPKSGKVDIEFRFERGRHGDGDPFDGPKSKNWLFNELAHAFPPGPGRGGDVHLDEDDDWSIDDDGGIDLFQVVVHEIGHALGLDHSRVKGSIMYPFYYAKKVLTLHKDDIAGIQILYGRKSKFEKTDEKTKEDLEICADPKIDTIFNSATDNTYVFKGKQYWKLMEGGIVVGYPKFIAATWKGLPSNIDAAYTSLSGKTYFFKGSEYWKYDGTRMAEESPRRISAGFPGIPNNVDAVTTRDGYGKVYFFKGTKYWRYDPDWIPHVDGLYPKPISKWRGLPNNLDAALTDGDYSYFFKDNGFHRMRATKFSVDRAIPYETGRSWFDCHQARG